MPRYQPGWLRHRAWNTKLFPLLNQSGGVTQFKSFVAASKAVGRLLSANTVDFKRGTAEAPSLCLPTATLVFVSVCSRHQ